jgi:N,N'-diacetyllegionaminate synthase
VGEKSQYEIIKECEISESDTAELKAYAESKNVDFMSTPFELESFRMLRRLGVEAVKISSCNLTNYPFLKEVAESELPVLLSTGMADIAEVVKGVEIFKKSGSPLMLFQCTSNYPSKLENANLKVIETFRGLFDVPVGFSDHTENNIAAIAAVALGAVSVEKHFTLSKELPGIDQKASLEPQDLKSLVKDIRDCELALGNPIKIRTNEEKDTSMALRRSLVAARDLQTGEVLTKGMIAIKRPGSGLPTDFISKIVGRKLAKSIALDEPFSLDHFIQ